MTISPADSLMNYVFSLVNREDLVVDQIKAYEKAKELPEKDREQAYIPIYIELEKFILANKPLVVKGEFTVQGLHKSVARQVALDKIGEAFRLLFFPENEKLFAFYNLVLDFPVKQITDSFGRGHLIDTVNKNTPGTLLAGAFSDSKFYPPSRNTASVLRHAQDGEHGRTISSRMKAKNISLRRDFSPDEARGEDTPTVRSLEIHLDSQVINKASREKIVSAFRKLNLSLYQEIASLLGKDRADSIANATRQFVENTYSSDFVTFLLQILPGFGEGEKPIVTVTPEAFKMLSNIGLGEIVTKGLVKNVDGELNAKDGKGVPVNITASALQSEAGNIEGIVIAAKDMSEIQRLQREKFQVLEKSKSQLEQKVKIRTQDLEKARIELERSIATKGEFMNIAAHELRTPLQPVIGYADRLLQKGDLTDWQKERLTIIIKNARNLLQLVQDILDINKMETGIMKFSWEEVDLSSLIKDIYESFRPSVEAKNLQFILDAPKTLSKVRGDPQRLTQVFSNLIDNAIKFTDYGSITIAAQEDKDTVTVAVMDTGIGIEERDTPKIFTKFFQTDSSLKRKQKGTGLGLAIAKAIIQAHKGEISVKSTLEKGSTFRVVLPKNV